MSSALSNVQVAEYYRDYGHLVLRRCRAVLGDRALAEDALQEVFVRVMLHGRSLSEATAKLAWLYRATDRCCYDIANRRKRRGERVELANETDQPATTTDPAATDAAARLLSGLNSDDQDLAIGVAEGATRIELAEELGLSRQTIHNRLLRLRDRARELLGGWP